MTVVLLASTTDKLYTHRFHMLCRSNNYNFKDTCVYFHLKDCFKNILKISAAMDANYHPRGNDITIRSYQTRFRYSNAVIVLRNHVQCVIELSISLPVSE